MVSYDDFTQALNCLVSATSVGATEAGPSRFQASPRTQHLVQCWQVLLLFGASFIFVDPMSGCWSELPPEAVATSGGVTGTGLVVIPGHGSSQSKL